MNERTRAEHLIRDARAAICALASHCDTSILRKYIQQIEQAERTIRIIDKKRILRAVVRLTHDGIGRRSSPKWQILESQSAALNLWAVTH